MGSRFFFSVKEISENSWLPDVKPWFQLKDAQLTQMFTPFLSEQQHTTASSQVPEAGT